ncbi:MAG: hypothetical protein LBR26_17480 [Prevotella sp.]|jgi:hypothetical protein|nr:hypothetical protein [Prevotella sp.]
MHYIIIIVAIVVILFFQFKSFFSTKTKIDVFRKIFPQEDNQFDLGYDDSEAVTIIARYSNKNAVLEDILDSINNYLGKNKGAVSDFHLMKDIVDRNCDSIEEEINTQIPMPLYLGLVGTMLGILIGIGFLVITGSLDELLNPSSTSTDGKAIKDLFGGVALAMIASIVGILLTTIGSHLAKKAKKGAERGKNIFLSWIQAELLPELSNDTTAVLEKMARNLTGFNKMFSENTRELRETLQEVNVSYRSQTELIQSINQLKIRSIATANIEVYENLKNCTNEIGVFSQYLQKANKYIGEINNLNQKLDDYERRTQIIENAGRFFERNEHWLAENLDSANLETKNALQRFNEMMVATLRKTQESLDSQFLAFNNSFQSQQEALEITIKVQEDIVKDKAQEISTIVEELKNITAVKTQENNPTESMSNLENITRIQNQKIENLTNAIQKLAEIKAVGGISPKIPQWLKATVITGTSLLSITCLAILIPLLIKWLSNLINWLF